MSVPATFTGEHADCGGSITFHPSAERDRLLAGEEVSLSSFCDQCGRPVSIRYALRDPGEAPSEASGSPEPPAPPAELRVADMPPPPGNAQPALLGVPAPPAGGAPAEEADDSIELGRPTPVSEEALTEPAMFAPPASTDTNIQVLHEAPRHLNESVLVLAGAIAAGEGPVAAARDSFSRLNDGLRQPAFSSMLDASSTGTSGGFAAAGRTLTPSSTERSIGAPDDISGRVPFGGDGGAPTTDEVAAEIARRFEAARERMARAAAAPAPELGQQVSIQAPPPPVEAASPLAPPSAPAAQLSPPSLEPAPPAVPADASQRSPAPAAPDAGPDARQASEPMVDLSAARGFDWGEADPDAAPTTNIRSRRKRIFQVALLSLAFVAIGYTAFLISSELQGRDVSEAEPTTQPSSEFSEPSELDGLETPAGEDPPAIAPEGDADTAGSDASATEGEAIDLEQPASDGGDS